MNARQLATYHASPEVLQQLKQVTLLGVVGPSGVGKTTLIERALAQDPALHLVISETSRSPRPGEQDGIDYHFRSREYMLRRILQREYAQLPPQVTNDLYATAPESYHPEGVSVLAIWADAIPDFRTLPFKTMRTLFIVPPSFTVWKERFSERNAIAKRLDEARRSYAFALQDAETKMLINDDLSRATTRFLHYAQGDPLTPELQAEQQRGRDCIRAIMAELQ